MPSLESIPSPEYSPTAPDCQPKLLPVVYQDDIVADADSYESIAYALASSENATLRDELASAKSDLEEAHDLSRNLGQQIALLNEELVGLQAFAASIDAKELESGTSSHPSAPLRRFAPDFRLVLMGGKEYLKEKTKSKRFGIKSNFWPTSRAEALSIMKGVRNDDIRARSLAEFVSENLYSAKFHAPGPAHLLYKEFMKRLDHEERRRNDDINDITPRYPITRAVVAQLYDPFGPSISQYYLAVLMRTIKDVTVPGIGPIDGPEFEEQLRGRDLLLSALPHRIGTADVFRAIFDYATHLYASPHAITNLFLKYNLDIKPIGRPRCIDSGTIPATERTLTEHLARYIIDKPLDARCIEKYCIQYQYHLLEAIRFANAYPGAAAI
jgi:hypothetical protein